MAQMPDARGIIIDLRGARGGLGHLPAYAAGLFVDRPDSDLGEMILRERRLRLLIVPREQHKQEIYRGRVAILVDGLTRSAGEIFAAGVQDLDRARVFGTRTAGAVLPSKIDLLPNGDRLQYAIANFTTPKGRVLEGTGVEPDVAIAPTRAQLLAGKDPVLEAALEWVQLP
jgi:carboxyl-terminal processing protease